MKPYDNFKARTINSTTVIQRASGMRAVSEDFRRGFEVAMWEAREIFMDMQDERTVEKVTAAVIRGGKEQRDEKAAADA